MSSLGLKFSRRSLLAGTGSLCVAARLPASVRDKRDDVAGLVEEATRIPRAMRDGEEPYVNPAYGYAYLPHNSYDYSVATAARSRSLIDRAKRLRGQPLKPDERETLETLMWDLECDVGHASFYWHQYPLGYRDSQTALLRDQFKGLPKPEERGDYLKRLHQAPAFVDSLRQRLLGQLQRGLTPPRSEAIRALEQLRIERQEVFDALNETKNDPVDGTAPPEAFVREIDRIARGPLSASFYALVAAVENKYIPPLDESSGIGKSPDVSAYYQEIARSRQSDAFSLEFAYEAARESLAAIDAGLARLRRSLGSTDDAATFDRALARDPRWLARDANDVGARLNDAVAKIQPLVPQFFHRLPKTPYRIAPLPEALSTRLLNGIYDHPTQADPRGTYFYNTARLDITTWVWARPLISHELFPGHHVQGALLFEAQNLSPYQKGAYISGFVEGWGEYARTLMEEARLYHDDPWSLYASKLLERRFALRTMVETGVNRPDWTWQKAQEALASDPLTRPTTTQQLAFAAANFRSNGASYWWGLRRFRELRRIAEASSGSAFDIRDFHDRVMQGNSLPFRLLEERLKPSGQAQRRA